MKVAATETEICAAAANKKMFNYARMDVRNRVKNVSSSLQTAPLVDSNPRHSSSAMLMLLSVVFLGLAVFLIYKFKR